MPHFDSSFAFGMNTTLNASGGKVFEFIKLMFSSSITMQPTTTSSNATYQASKPTVALAIGKCLVQTTREMDVSKIAPMFYSTE